MHQNAQICNLNFKNFLGRPPYWGVAPNQKSWIYPGRELFTPPSGVCTDKVFGTPPNSDPPLGECQLVQHFIRGCLLSYILLVEIQIVFCVLLWRNGPSMPIADQDWGARSSSWTGRESYFLASTTGWRVPSSLYNPGLHAESNGVMHIALTPEQHPLSRPFSSK